VPICPLRQVEARTTLTVPPRTHIHAVSPATHLMSRRDSCRTAPSYAPQEAEMMSVNRSNARSAIAVFGILALTVLLLPQPASAQFTTARLGCIVRDKSGGGVT